MLPKPNKLLAFEQQKKRNNGTASHSATPEFIFRGIALGFSNGVVVLLWLSIAISRCSLSLEAEAQCSSCRPCCGVVFLALLNLSCIER